MLGRKGDMVQVTIFRSGEPGELTLRPALVTYSLSGLRGLATHAMSFYSLFFLIVGLNVLGLRLEDRDGLATGAAVCRLYLRRATV